MNRVAVIVLNYRGIDDTIQCLASLSQQAYLNFTIIAVENGSGDDSVKRFKELEEQYADRLKTLYNTKNLGFDGGVNTGIRWALEHDFEYIALFNNDAIADKNWLRYLVEEADARNNFGIITGLLLHGDGKTIDSSGDWYSKWGLSFPRHRNQPAEKAPSAGEVFGASGGASLYRAKMFRQIGLFDEDFFAYYEDVDMSFRAQLAGWKVFYQPKSIAYHQQGGTSSKMPGFTIYQTFKNLPLVYIKNVPFTLLFSIGIRFYPAYWLIYFHAITQGNGWPATKGAFHSIGYSLKSLGKRWRIQKNKTVSTSYIASIIWPDLPPEQTGLRKVRKFFTGK